MSGAVPTSVSGGGALPAGTAVEGNAANTASPDARLTATCVRVPVFVGHAEAINVEFDGKVTEKQIRNSLKSTPGLTIVDSRVDEGYVTPAECAGEDDVYVSRIRMDPTIDNGVNIWVVADNLRKGAALNTVQIAEELIKSHL